MAAGNGDMWVADAGENIEIGDYLISSHIPGHAMKDAGDSEISYIVARAAEPIHWEYVDDTIDGVKHKRISTLFESFIRNHALEKVTAELSQVKAELHALQSRVDQLEMLQSQIAQLKAVVQSAGMK
jgi:hypothetical protein